MTLTVIVPLGLFVLALVLAAWGLPLATAFARTWTRLYTRLVPVEQRERRREETEYHRLAQIEGDQKAGYKPSEIGLRILGRVVWGVADDITWAGVRIRLFDRRPWWQWVAMGATVAGFTNGLVSGGLTTWVIVTSTDRSALANVGILLICASLICIGVSVRRYVSRATRLLRELESKRNL